MTCQLEVKGGKVKENLKGKGKACLLFFIFLIGLPLHFSHTGKVCVCVCVYQTVKSKSHIEKKKLIPLKIAVTYSTDFILIVYNLNNNQRS